MTLEQGWLDPFGLWQPPPEPEGEVVSFEIPAPLSQAEDAPAAVWRVDLAQEAGDPLAQRAAQVAAIQHGLAQAEDRFTALLAARRSAQLGGMPSFSVEAASLADSAAEQRLTDLLNQLEPDSAVSFGLIEDVGAAVKKASARVKEIAGLSSALQELEGMLQQFNRQFLHFAWVETTTDGALLARTTVNWAGDMNTYWQSGMARMVEAQHRRSLELALKARAASMETILTVMRMAAKLALAISTPLGTLQAMALGWQFVRDVIQPLLRALQNQPAAQPA